MIICNLNMRNNASITNNKEIVRITGNNTYKSITQNNNKMVLYKNNLFYNEMEAINFNKICHDSENSFYSNSYVLNSNSLMVSNSNKNNLQSFVGYMATTTIDRINSRSKIYSINSFPYSKQVSNNVSQVLTSTTSNTSDSNQVTFNKSNDLYQQIHLQNYHFSYNQHNIDQNKNNHFDSRNGKVNTLTKSPFSLNSKTDSIINSPLVHPCIDFTKNSLIIQTRPNNISGKYIEKSNIITYPVYNNDSNASIIQNNINTNTNQMNNLNNINIIGNTIPNNIEVTNNNFVPNNMSVNINTNTIKNSNIISNNVNTPNNSNVNGNIISTITINASQSNTFNHNSISLENCKISNNNNNNIITTIITNSPKINSNINSSSMVLPSSIIKTITPNLSPKISSSLNNSITNIINNTNTPSFNYQEIKNTVSPTNYKYLINNNGNLDKDLTIKVYDQSILNDSYNQRKGSREGRSKIKIHMCEYCGKTFNKTSRLRDHMLTHVKTRAFQCETCHLPFKRKNDMLRHMRIHTGYKPYKCKFCGKGFTRSDALSRHVKGGLCQIVSLKQHKEDKNKNIGNTNTDNNINEKSSNSNNNDIKNTTNDSNNYSKDINENNDISNISNKNISNAK